MIKRHLEGVLRDLLKRKNLVILGARQVGKTTFIRELFKNNPETMFLNGDEPDVQAVFENATSTRLKALIGDKKVLVIDEAQRIENIGLKLKLIIDNMPEIRVAATGSSSFDLANKINEPLTGRKFEIKMFPFSFGEMAEHHGLLEEKRLIPHRLVFGYYPEVVNNFGRESEVLRTISNDYLYKDILVWEQVKKTDKLIKLLQALAYQIGSQVSYNELAQICEMDPKTVEKYITILEQCYIVFRLGSFSRNLRNELKHSRKIYFYDNGIRNALIANFSVAEQRADVGVLWENFAIAERMKYLEYSRKWNNKWFWRTVEQKEIDYIEEADGQINTYEFKWSAHKKAKLPKQFLENYKGSVFSVISPHNVDEFLVGA